MLRNSDDLSEIEAKSAVLNYLILHFQLNDSDNLRAALKERLSKTFYNNLNKRFKKLSKNKRTYEQLAKKYESCLNNDLHFKFDENEIVKAVNPGNN